VVRSRGWQATRIARNVLAMTVCLAALCQSDNRGPLVVAAADRMVTLGGFIQFEHAIPKMARPSSLAITMLAGDTLVGTRLAQTVTAKFAGSSPKVADIAAALSEQYVEVRQGRMDGEILKPRGLNLQSFYGRHTALSPQVVMMLDDRMAKFDLQVEFLLTGVDGEGAHIFTVHNPGSPERQHDVIGYAAIGSGTVHALQAMIGFNHSPLDPLRDTLYRVYAAKRRAEVAPGVGKDTDLMVISGAGITELDDGQLSVLGSLFLSQESSREALLAESLKDLTLEVLEASAEGEEHGPGADS
jgi:hypothetical protein